MKHDAARERGLHCTIARFETKQPQMLGSDLTPNRQAKIRTSAYEESCMADGAATKGCSSAQRVAAERIPCPFDPAQ